MKRLLFHMEEDLFQYISMLTRDVVAAVCLTLTLLKRTVS